MEKLKTCKHCGAQIAKNAKFCPNCGGKNKKPIFLRWWFIALVILVIIVALGGKGSSKSSETQQAGTSSQKNVESALTEQSSNSNSKKDDPTAEPTNTPTPKPTATPTPEPTIIPKEVFWGTWKSCGLATEKGKYYSVEQLEKQDNYNITDIIFVIKEASADLYVQGKYYYDVAWVSTKAGVTVGTNEMFLDKGKLTWKDNDNELIYFEKITDSQNIEKIEINPLVGATVGQKNALKKAKSYLSFTAFSYTGLIKQLEFEQFTHEEAIFAADNCGADWNEQAVKKAKSYLSFTSFSKNGLISQLEFEGFTHEQAVYAVEQVGY